jgi:hypothetical protein
MIELWLFLLIPLCIKHWYVDFVNQSKIEIQSKAIYGDLAGIHHSFKHGIGTSICIFLVLGSDGIIISLLLGLVDFMLHYHIDWIKMNYGARDINDPRFWNHLGLDQLAHQLCYIAYIGYIIAWPMN